MKFVFDLDGTICFDGQTIAQEIKDILENAHLFGHQVVFASARSYRDCIAVLGEKLAQNLVIGLNGGLAYEEGQLKLSHKLDDHVFQSALKSCQTYNLPYFVDDHFNYSYSQADKIPFIDSVSPLGQAVLINELTQPIKMVIYMGNHLNLLDDIIAELNSFDKCHLSYHELEECLYLNPDQTTKASTILDIIGKNYVAFGNDKNDIEMFEQSLYGVQVGDFAYLEKYSDEKVSANSRAVATKIHDLFKNFQED
ncbi:HAD hydrolase family protein [Streptococcus loxodontisalivarius]|uniref:Hydroxymethylpyrimidine pyrophosphatase-like HAD family hydrolase n=1 Tax=Streptococcus loxodontisalivarius TaxID=1349415 RepID=A0ABS2PR25_9STRE|nr:HAD hydrolase family protein [Streptococcus loxodontisalivarius]MBM7641827.1 hydroxymethylpyrimidine pyrophosphatase-like HAD family hydrolase [Streptococcus loxodontisalivarius]